MLIPGNQLDALLLALIVVNHLYQVVEILHGLVEMCPFLVVLVSILVTFVNQVHILVHVALLAVEV